MEFDINELVERYKAMDFLSIHQDLAREVNRLDVLAQRPAKGRNDYAHYKMMEYRKYAGDFLFFLNTGVTPNGIGLEGLKIFLPVIQSLVDQKQLKKEVLDRFNSKE